MATWSFVLDDRTGAARAFLQPDSFTYTGRMDGGADLEFEVHTQAAGALELEPGARRLRAYRDNVLVFHGDLDEPMTTSATAVKAVARDPFAELLRMPVASPDGWGPVTHTGVDQGEIARLTIVNLNEAFADEFDGAAGMTYAGTAIKPGTVTASRTRDREYPMGVKAGEIIQGLAGVDDGYHFLLVPIEYDAGAIAELEVRYPDTGAERPGVRFEYGQGTLANLLEFEEELRLPRNFVLGLGGQISSEPGGPADTTISTSAEDVASRVRYGHRGMVASWSDVTDNAVGGTLDQHTIGALLPDPPAVYTLKPGPEAPLLFEDFDIGDTVELMIRHGRVDVAGSMRVNEASVTVSANGTETLSSLVLSTASLRRVQARPDLRVFRVLDFMGRRLDSLERR